jgi:hypothetical protein
MAAAAHLSVNRFRRENKITEIDTNPQISSSGTHAKANSVQFVAERTALPFTSTRNDT